MKKTGKRIITGILAVSLMLSAVGCQKSANTIVELGDSEAKEEKEDDGPVDPNGPKVTEKEVWQDSLSGPDLESISIDTTMRTDYDLDSLSTYTKQYEHTSFFSLAFKSIIIHSKLSLYIDEFFLELYALILFL